VKATEVTAGLAESNGSLLPGIWRDSLHVTCGMTACTPGSAPGPTLDNEYGKTLPFFTVTQTRPSAVNKTLFAAERRRLLSIDISCPWGTQQQTRRMPLLLSINATDGRMDA